MTHKNPLPPDWQKPKFYGRRKGKMIRQNRSAAYNLVMPWAQLHLPEGEAKLDPKSFFDFPVSSLWLEIGFGNGEQLLHIAKENPTVGMIGCEPFLNGVAALCRGIKDDGINNIRIFQDDARLLMTRLKSNSLGRCFLLNSDPWPKKRHHKRRFVQEETLDELHRLLETGAEFRMSSDDPGLAAWQLEKTYFHKGYRWQARSSADWTERPADMIETRYQGKGLKEGRAITYLRFTTV
jgi:tRNA (guanine-N7-)-methyltransferase